jgi:alanine racemase
MTSPVATFPSPPRRAIVRLDVVRSNARILFAETPGSRIVVDLRANAYGHGAEAIAEALDDLPVDAFLLSSERAAEPLVNLGLKTPVIPRSQLTADGSHLVGPELLGLDSPTDSDPRGRGLLPALTLSARVLSVKKVGAGEGVSYGYVYRTRAATTLAMVCLGYSDGIDRHACERGRAWFDGSTHPIAGRVAMDVFMLDVGDHAVAPGDEVVLFGDEGKGYPSPVSWAADLGKSAAEVTATLGDRIVRSHV